MSLRSSSRPAAALACLLSLPLAAVQAQVLLFDQADFNGRRAELHQDTPNFAAQQFNGSTASLVVLNGRWELCTEPNYGGRCVVFGRGQFPSLDRSLERRLNSARQVDEAGRPTAAAAVAPQQVVGNFDLTLFEHGDFGGRRVELKQDAPQLDAWQFGNTTSSLLVLNGRWQVCTEPNYGGRCVVYGRGQYPGVERGLNDRINSARRVDEAGRPVGATAPAPVPAGPPAVLHGGAPIVAVPGLLPQGGAARVVLYRETNFQGDSVTLTGATRELESLGMNDMAHSMVIEGGNWELCNDMDYGGDCRVYGPGRYATLEGSPQLRRLSSVRPAGGNAGQAVPPVATAGATGTAAVELYSNLDYGGRRLDVGAAMNNLRNAGFNDAAQSLVVRSGRWQLCTEADYTGTCYVLGPGQYPRLGDLGSRLSSLRPAP